MAQRSLRDQASYPQLADSSIEGPTDYWYPAPEKSFFRRFFWIWFFGSFLSVLFILAVGAGLYLWARSDYLIPGVHANELSIGNLRKDEAEARLEDDWDRRDIRLEYGDSAWVASPTELGLTFNSEETVQQAWSIGRNIDSFKSWLMSDKTFSVNPVWNFDVPQAQSFLYDLAPQIAKTPIDAGIEIVGGQAQMTPAIAGQVLDVPATLAILQENSGLVLRSGHLPLVVQPLYPDFTDTHAIVEEANHLLGTTFSLELFDPVQGDSSEVPIGPETWSHWLTLEASSDGHLNWVLDQEQLTYYIDDLNKVVGPDRYLAMSEVQSTMTQFITQQKGSLVARLYHPEQQHIVAPGDTLSSIGRQFGIPYPYIQEENPGSVDQLYPGQTLIIPSPDILLPLPIIADKRIVVSISQQRVRVFDHDELKWDWPASTGIDSSPTAPGVFQIQSHEMNAYATNWDLWMPNFMGVYRPVPDSDFMNGFHGFPTRNDYNLLWTGDLGRKVTYGCILLGSDNAAALYDWAEEGVVVEIQQ